MASAVSFQSGFSQPLPSQSELAGGILVTIWFVAMPVFTLMWFHIVVARRIEKWHGFESILFGAASLCIWYFWPFLDRWMHYTGHRVIYGYVIVGPFWELSRPVSTLFFLWGEHRVVWVELEPRFTEKQKYGWLVAKVLLLLAFLVTIFYWLLYIAFASVWVSFASLDTIADVGTRWCQFWISMTALFFGFSLLIATAAAVTLYHARFRLDGHVRWNRLCLFLAVLSLFIRCTIEFAIACQTYSATATRQDLRLLDDAAFGTLTSLFLGFMYALARPVSGGSVDLGGEEARQVAAWVRWGIIRDLNDQTSWGRKSAPPLGTLLDAAEKRLDDDSSSEVTRAAGLRCIDQLRKDYASLDPKIKDDLRARKNTRREQHRNSRLSNGTWGGASTNGAAPAPPVEMPRRRPNRFTPQTTTTAFPALSDVSEERTRYPRRGSTHAGTYV